MDVPKKANTSEPKTAMYSIQHGRGEKLLSARDVADRLGMSEGWVRDHARGAKPSIRAVKLGSRLRFREIDVEEFIQQCLTEAKKRGWAA